MILGIILATIVIIASSVLLGIFIDDRESSSRIFYGLIIILSLMGIIIKVHTSTIDTINKVIKNPESIGMRITIDNEKSDTTYYFK